MIGPETGYWWGQARDVYRVNKDFPILLYLVKRKSALVIMQQLVELTLAKLCEEATTMYNWVVDHAVSNQSERKR